MVKRDILILNYIKYNTPLKVLENEYFNQYLVSKKSINKKGNILNLDDLPSYY